MPSVNARVFTIGDPVRIITDRPLAAFLRGNVRHRRPGLHLQPASYRGIQGFVCATSHPSTGGPPTGYEVTFYAPADLPAPDAQLEERPPWFPDALPRTARLEVHGLLADDLELDPAPAETWEQFWDRFVAAGEEDVDAEAVLWDAQHLLDAKRAVQDPDAWRVAFREASPEFVERKLKGAQEDWALVRRYVEQYGGIANYLVAKTEGEGGLWTSETEEAFAAIRAAEAGDRSQLDALLDAHSRFRPYQMEAAEPVGSAAEVPTTACFDCDALVPVAETWVNKKGLALCEGCFTKREAKGRARRGRER